MSRSHAERCLITALLLWAVTGLMLCNCGKVSVNVDERNYEPKIVVEGFLIPGRPPENIRFSRNYPLNREIRLQDVLLTNAQASITDLSSAKAVTLEFDISQLAYRYPRKDFIIAPGNSYRLNVSATIEGRRLSAASTTTVPQAGFRIKRQDSHLGPFFYRERDENGNLKNYEIVFQRSPSTDFYALSIVAQYASTNNFIEENPFGIKAADLTEDRITRLRYEYSWTQTRLGSAQENSSLRVSWFDLWFYGNYRAILYAGDKNYKNYFLTHNNVQDIDGNLYEPKFNFEGQGIGVFGSMVADTVFFEVLRR